MNNIKLKKYLIIPAVIFLLIFCSCTDFDEPAAIDSPTISYSQNPAISQILPSDSAIAGIREITILGSNFYPSNIDSNFVYFQGKKAIIKNVTADKMVICRPLLSDEQYGQPLNITLGVPTALGTAKIKNYKFEMPVRSFGDFSRYNYTLTAAEVDNQENIYIATRRAVIKVPPDGINIVTWASLSSDFAKITDLKLGPPNSSQKFLYALIDKTSIYRIDLTTAAPVKFATFPVIVDKCDFDAQGNLYAAKNSGVYVMHADQSISDLKGYKGLQVNELRVYNGNLYVASPKVLYKSQILDNTGNLGPQQVIADLTSTENLTNCEIGSFSIGSDGTFYLCLKGHPQYSIFVLEGEGAINPFYTANILPRLVDQIIWGSGRYLYLSRGSMVRDSVRFYKMGMDRNSAPYTGR